MTNQLSRVTLPVAAVFAACLLAAGCSSSSSTVTSQPPSMSASAPAGGGPASGTPQSAASITIKDFSFAVSGSAAAGATVRVTNNDGEAHTVTADSGSAFDVTIQPGKTATFTAPMKAGSYKFHCNFHSNMHGTLTVRG